MSTSTWQKLEWSTMSEGYKRILIEILKGYETATVETEDYEMSAEIRDMLNSPGIVIKFDKHGEIENILPANEDVEKLMVDAGIKY
jgi:hypothetical protein